MGLSPPGRVRLCCTRSGRRGFAAVSSSKFQVFCYSISTGGRIYMVHLRKCRCALSLARTHIYFSGFFYFRMFGKCDCGLALTNSVTEHTRQPAGLCAIIVAAFCLSHLHNLKLTLLLPININ